MKFWGGLVLLTLLFNVEGVVLASERTNSEVGITFYQKNDCKSSSADAKGFPTKSELSKAASCKKSSISTFTAN